MQLRYRYHLGWDSAVGATDAIGGKASNRFPIKGEGVSELTLR